MLHIWHSPRDIDAIHWSKCVCVCVGGLMCISLVSKVFSICYAKTNSEYLVEYLHLVSLMYVSENVQIFFPFSGRIMCYIWMSSLHCTIWHIYTQWPKCAYVIRCVHNFTDSINTVFMIPVNSPIQCRINWIDFDSNVIFLHTMKVLEFSIHRINFFCQNRIFKEKKTDIKCQKEYNVKRIRNPRPMTKVISKYLFECFVWNQCKKNHRIQVFFFS